MSRPSFCQEMGEGVFSRVKFTLPAGWGIFLQNLEMGGKKNGRKRQL